MKTKILGISLLELMLSLAIIAIILVAAMRYYQTTRESQQVNAAAEMVTAVYSAGASWIQFNKDFSGVNIAAFVSNGSLPASFANPNANPWGGAINTAPGQTTPPNTFALTVSLTHVSTTACSDLAAKVQAKMPNATANCSLIGIGSGLPTFTAIFEFGS
jgi:type II secretory pathway pseudopilin PulG